MTRGENPSRPPRKLGRGAKLLWALLFGIVFWGGFIAVAISAERGTLPKDPVGWLEPIGWFLRTFLPVLAAAGAIWKARRRLRDEDLDDTQRGTLWLAVAMGMVCIGLVGVHLADASWSPPEWVRGLLALLAVAGAFSDATPNADDVDASHDDAAL